MNFLLAALVGGLCVTDTTAVGQFMISRPIFCAPVIGLVTGDIVSGIYIGMIMELVWISAIPLGNFVPPDSTVVAAAASYLASAYPGDGKGYLVLLILALVPFGALFKKLDMLHREFNIYFSHKAEERISEGDTGYIDYMTYASVLLFFLKGFIFLMLLMWFGRLLFPFLYMISGPSLQKALADVFYILPAVGLGSAITTFTFKKSAYRGISG